MRETNQADVIKEVLDSMLTLLLLFTESPMTKRLRDEVSAAKETATELADHFDQG